MFNYKTEWKKREGDYKSFLGHGALSLRLSPLSFCFPRFVFSGKQLKWGAAGGWVEMEMIIPLVRETIKLQNIKETWRALQLSYRSQDTNISQLEVSHLNYLGLRAYRSLLNPEIRSQTKQNLGKTTLVRCKQLAPRLVKSLWSAG